MRYRVEAADRPDALYAVWRGQVFRAQRSTADGTVLLVVLQGEQAPEGFDAEWNGFPAKVVPGEEAGSTFSLHTNVYFDDDIYRVAQSSASDTLTLRWTGQDEARARDLGLTDFTVRVGPERLTALWQERHDFVEVAADGPEPGSEDQNGLLRGIGRTLRGIMPEGWQRVGAQFRQVGDYAELEVRAVVGEEAVSVSPPAQLSELFARLRTAMFTEGTGTWFQGTFTLGADANFDFDFDLDAEPGWRLPPGSHGRQGGRSYEAELARFPRDRGKVPDWLAAKGGLPLDVTFRQPKIVDNHVEGEKPQVNRPPVPQEEIRPLLDYLFRAPVVLSRPGRLTDILTPNGKQDVPDAFHTDGTWIWPAAVPHYLRRYGLPPDPELLDHVRAHKFRPAYVSGRLLATAEAEVLGKPHPPQSVRDLAEPDAVANADRVAEPQPELRASEALTVLRRRLGEQGVLPGAYRIGEAADGAWCLRRTPMGWEVALHDGEPVDPVYFPRVEAAARFLLGTLLLFPARARVSGPDETQLREPPTDWPVVPMRGEPPLHFLHGKRMVTVPPGTVLQRFGQESGNLLHAEDATFAETALAAEREHERHLYRVRRPLRVLTGIAVPWGGLPGGAVSYLLSRAVGHHVETGALERR
ncbi:hypothetical protein CFN78_13815 [Amycolatopsis antarctica]|uniref:TNT domain-containing protein n=1 Tax=Amycolatopsis antarctica TaxID=1854586 RepID=A0A263D3N8_9PSEU|nr:TNT domain-containing protein [Amycolatopsis antarctica]OZM72698.1 hypothetical protein CFN78_13815 [Amycolatopsis antarctica]